MQRNKRSPHLAAFTLLICGMAALSGAMPGIAQLQTPGVGTPTPGGFFGSGPIALMGQISKEVQEFYTKHGKLPASSAEEDALLKAVVARITGHEPAASPALEGNYRVLGNIYITSEPSLVDTPLAELRKNPPPLFKAPPAKLVIDVLGNDKFLVWFSATDGRPALDSLGQALILRQECMSTAIKP